MGESRSIWVGNSNTGPDVAGIDNDTVMLGVAARRYFLARGAGTASAEMMRSGLRGRDAWTVAQELAAGGDFTGAAHALYLALLGSLAKRDLLRIHGHLRAARKDLTVTVQFCHC